MRLSLVLLDYLQLEYKILEQNQLKAIRFLELQYHHKRLNIKYFAEACKLLIMKALTEVHVVSAMFCQPRFYRLPNFFYFTPINPLPI